MNDERCPNCGYSVALSPRARRELEKDAERYRALRYGILNNIDPDYQGVLDNDAPMSEQVADFDRVADGLKAKVDIYVRGTTEVLQ